MQQLPSYVKTPAQLGSAKRQPADRSNKSGTGPKLVGKEACSMTFASGCRNGTGRGRSREELSNNDVTANSLYPMHDYYMAFTSQLGGVVDAHVDSTLGKHSHAAPVSEQTICMLRKRWQELCLLHDTIPESA